jgi:hypothetical protein
MHETLWRVAEDVEPLDGFNGPVGAAINFAVRLALTFLFPAKGWQIRGGAGVQ